MQTPKDEADRVQYWISLGHQPGVSAWFTLWRVVHSKRVKPAPRAKAAMPGQCTA